MPVSIDNKEYNVIVLKKNNKNTYIRINDNLDIVVTTNYFVSDKDIKKLICENEISIQKMILKKENKLSRDNDECIYLFGKKYYVIYGNLFKNIDIRDDKIFVLDEKHFNKYLNNLIKETFLNHLNKWYNIFEEKINYPKLKIRIMKTRWGVCNYVRETITLNTNLYKYDIACLDYVIIHELSHLIHHNHSNNFWCLVSKYCPNYKKIRKILRE